MSQRNALLVVLLAGAALAVTGVGAARAAGEVDVLFAFGTSARALGVGGARVAYAGGAGSNPAGLGSNEGIAVASLYVQQFGGVGYGAAAFSAPHVELGAATLDSGWIEAEGNGFRYTSLGLSCAAGASIGPVGLGARWRLLRVSAPFAGTGWAADAAFLIELGALRVGAVGEALVSSAVRYEGGAREPWTPDLAVGAAVTLEPFEKVAWTATAEVQELLGAAPRVVGGMEIWVGSLAGRLGWDGGGPTLGLSVRVRGVGVDWSCAARSDLGTSHRVSLEVLF